MANTVSTDALRPEIWKEELFKDSIDNLYFTRKGLMGEGPNNVVQIMSDLKKSKGDTITIGLTAKLSGAGVTGDNELEGNEEAISPYSESISIDQLRNAVRLTGKKDEKINAYNMRKDAKDKLSMWRQENIERQVFLKLAGVTNTTLTDTAGTTVGALCAWSNTPDYIPDATTNAGTGDRYLCADYASGATSIADTDLITPNLISRVKVKAATASPKILPLRIDGVDHYVMFIHPRQAFDLQNNAVFAQAQREAATRGSKNPVFTGALGMWNNVIIHEHEYVPFLDIDVALNSFRGAASGTDFAAVDAYRALLCGRQAAVFAECSNDQGWVEETFDYGNKHGFSTSILGGIQKVMFNSLEYGVVALDTAATAV